MLISEIRGWHWAITWDNAYPADSSTMFRALGRLGHVTKTQTKTTALLAPKKNVDWRRIRQALVENLNRQTGNAVYANLRTRKAFQWGRKTRFHWKQIG